MQDELFNPTVEAPPPLINRPWSVDSIAYPAFIGGPMTAALLGILNHRRLALVDRGPWLIAGTGLAGFLAHVAVAVAYAEEPVITKLAGRLGGVAVWVTVLVLQRRAFRTHLVRGGAVASLLGPGIAAVIGCGLLENALVYLLAAEAS